MASPVRVRFAPSPTGDLHIGGLRVALFNWLFARQNKGTFILRIEDTDQKRYQPESIKSILEGLSWAGLDWDEGPYRAERRGSSRVPESRNNAEIEINEKGEFGPYFQSQRTEIYRKHVEILFEKGSAYRCFCTPERLEEMRRSQEARKLPPMYDKQCGKLSTQEVEQKTNEGVPYVIRLKVPEKVHTPRPDASGHPSQEGILEIHDLIRGAVKFDLSLVDDQVLLKSDGYPTYHLANVVDDHLMGVTHVLRGEDWLSSLPKHILLYQGFEWDVPQFGHLPLILAPDKTKLSKRHGAVSVLALRDIGYLPEALLNFTLLLGWNPGKGSVQEIFTKDEMITRFSLEGIQKSPAIFNYEKLNWMNGQYVKQLSVHAFTEHVLPHLFESGLLTPIEAGEWVTADGRSAGRAYVEKVAALAQPRLIFAKEVVKECELFFTAPSYDVDLLQWKHTGLTHARAHLLEVQSVIRNMEESDFIMSFLDQKVKQWIQEKGLGMGDVLWPLRVALTGATRSPSPFEVMGVLGKVESLKRIDEAIEKLSFQS